MITFENIQQLEKYTLMVMHGLFNQLKLGIISINNAEHTSYTLYDGITSSLGVKPDIIDLIHKGDRVRRLLQHLIYQLKIQLQFRLQRIRTIKSIQMWNSMTNINQLAYYTRVIDI